MKQCVQFFNTKKTVKQCCLKKAAPKVCKFINDSVYEFTAANEQSY